MPTFPESHRDLLDANVASLATLGHDGFPHVSELWFLYDSDGKLKISLNTARQKTKNLRKRPQCTLLILDLENPYRYLKVRAVAQIEPDDDYAFADKVGAKYGTDLRSRDLPGETRVIVTLDPVRIREVAIG